MNELQKNNDLAYQLQTLASYEPSDLDNPEMEVAYEDFSGYEDFSTVCLIELGSKSLARILNLEDQVKNTIPISKLEELISDLKSKPFVDVRYLEVSKIENLISEAKR